MIFRSCVGTGRPAAGQDGPHTQPPAPPPLLDNACSSLIARHPVFPSISQTPHGEAQELRGPLTQLVASHPWALGPLLPQPRPPAPPTSHSQQLGVSSFSGPFPLPYPEILSAPLVWRSFLSLGVFSREPSTRASPQHHLGQSFLPHVPAPRASIVRV